MITALGRLLCRLADRLLGLSERLLRGEASTAVRIDQSNEAATRVAADRPLVNFDHDSLSAAFALLAAVERSDVTAYHVLTKHSDATGLTLSLVFAVTDALAAPSSTDVAAYCDDLFDRLARRRE
jgi:hypothetical protein